MHMISNLIKFTLLTATLVACAPKYQENNIMTGGYKTTVIQPGVYRLQYFGGILSERSTPSAQDKIVMQRAAELTLQNGYQYFLVDIDPTSHPAERYYRVQCFNAVNPPPGAINAGDFLQFNPIPVKQPRS